jgi:hypothetical protein
VDRFRLRVAAVVAVALLAPVAAGCAGPGHPEPREDVTASRVLERQLLAGYTTELAAYEAARRYPQVLDGIYCYCHCSKHSGHRSLLTCFESRHGAACDVCMAEAILAARMHEQGAGLDQIRQAVDARFGS